jgi:hypothetical protein
MWRFTLPLISQQIMRVCELCNEVMVYFYSRLIQMIVPYGGIILILY